MTNANLNSHHYRPSLLVFKSMDTDLNNPVHKAMLYNKQILKDISNMFWKDLNFKFSSDPDHYYFWHQLFRACHGWTLERVDYYWKIFNNFGYNINLMETANGLRALNLAVIGGASSVHKYDVNSLDKINFLLSKGAKITKCSRQNLTPLHLAILLDLHDVFERFSNCDHFEKALNIKSEDGYSPLDMLTLAYNGELDILRGHNLKRMAENLLSMNP